MSRVFIRATVPDDLLQEFVQHIRDFDATHADCEFEVMADCPDMSVEKMVGALRVEPALSFTEILERKKPS
jgi:hypothetical protein